MKRQVNHTFDSSNTRLNIARILALLAEPRTYEQLHASLHMSDRSLRHHISHLKSGPNRRVRVHSYLFLRNRHVTVLALGAEPDAIKPKQTTSERNAKRAAKVKATPELLDRALQYEKARWLMKKPKTPQSWASSLFVGVRLPLNAEG